MATSSANDIIERAMVKAKVIHPGEPVRASIVAQVFDDLNDMLESWALERLMVYARVFENFPLTIGQEVYTYGPGGDFDSSRPLHVLDECYVRTGETDFDVPMRTLKVYRSRSTKDTSARPKMMAVNEDYPLATVYLWPTPETTYDFYISAWKQLVAFPDRTTAVDLPPGYRRAIVHNLAIEVSPQFGKTAAPELVGIAGFAKASIKKANRIPSNSQTTDLRSMTNRNIRSPYFQSGPFS